MQNLGYLLIIITNQSGIARGYYSEGEYKELEAWLLKRLEEEGITITGSYYCPHLKGAPLEQYAIECECRKPKLGMFEKAIQEHSIDIENSVAIGDKIRDLEICKNGKTKGFLLYSEKKQWNNIWSIEGGISEVADILLKNNEKNCRRNI